MRRHFVGQVQSAGGRPENVELFVERRNPDTLVESFTDGDTTPSVRSNEQGMVYKTANTTGTTISDFDDGFIGQSIQVIINDANTTIDFTSSGLKGNGGVDWSPSTDDWMTCIYDGTDWFCDVHESLYETGSFVTNWSGFTVAKESTWNYTRMGKVVVLHLDGTLSGTSNASGFTSGATDVPSSLRPTETTVKCLVGVQDNGTYQVGLLNVSSGGQISFLADVAQNGFTASGTKGIAGGYTFTYLID